MKYLVPFVLLALLATAPASAQPRPGDDGRGYGHAWRGGEGRGESRGDGRGDGRGYRDNNDGRYQRQSGSPNGDRPDGGRGGRSFPGAKGGLYAQPNDGDRGSGPGQWRGQQNEAREGVREGRFQSMGEVLSRLRQRQPGQQLDAGLGEGPGGRPVYRVRWAAKDGRLIDYTVDAQTGAILSEQGR